MSTIAGLFVALLELNGQWCPRPSPGSVVTEPEDLRSENGLLEVDLTVHNEKEADGSTRSLLKSMEAGFRLPCLNHACDKNVNVMSDLFGSGY